VVLLWWKRSGERGITLPEERRIDLGFLFLATSWALVIVVRQSATVLDTVLMVGLFAGYVWHTSKEAQQEPHLIGPPLAIAALGVRRRRVVTVVMFAYSALVILASAEPFAEGLVHTGTRFGIDEFLLVQWLAPLASEAPEFVVVAIFAWRGATTAAMGTLVSSKINQWTLLVGMLPVIYSIALGEPSGLPLDERQKDELELTAAQTLAAVALMLDRRLSWRGASALAILFIAQFFLRGHLVAFTWIYFGLALIAVVVQRTHIAATFRDFVAGWRGDVDSAA